MVILFIYQQLLCGVTDDGYLMFPAKLLLCLLLISYWSMVHVFGKSKRPQTHLLMSISSIKNMVGYQFYSPKIIVWSDW